MNSFIFCEILSGRAEASKVYEDDLCLAFMDIHPVNPGHLLVVVKNHATDLTDLPPETGAHLFQVAQRIALSPPASDIKCEGVNLFLAHGAVAGQDVFYAHLHVIPRYPRDGFGFRFSPRYLKRPSRASLNETALKIRSILEQEN